MAVGKCPEGFTVLEPGVFAGSIDAFMALIYLNDRERIRQVIANAQHTMDRYAVEFRVVRPDGVVRWLAANGCWLQRAPEQPRLLSVVADITERKRAETVFAMCADDTAVRLLVGQDERANAISMNSPCCSRARSA